MSNFEAIHRIHWFEYKSEAVKLTIEQKEINKFWYFILIFFRTHDYFSDIFHGVLTNLFLGCTEAICLALLMIQQKFNVINRLDFILIQIFIKSRFCSDFYSHTTKMIRYCYLKRYSMAFGQSIWYFQCVNWASGSATHLAKSTTGLPNWIGICYQWTCRLCYRQLRCMRNNQSWLNSSAACPVVVSNSKRLDQIFFVEPKKYLSLMT